MLPSQIPPPIGKFGVVIFDGSCGVCSIAIGSHKGFFERYGFTVAALQEDWIGKVVEVNQTTLLQGIHLYSPTGETFCGIDVFQQVSSKVWWLVPLALLLRVPVLKSVLSRLYCAVAARRKTISRVCGLQKRNS